MDGEPKTRPTAPPVRASQADSARTSRALWVAAVVLILIGAGTWYSTHRDRERQAREAMELSHANAFPGGVQPAQKKQLEISVTKLPAPAAGAGGTATSQADRDALTAALEPYRRDDFIAAAMALSQVTRQYPQDGEAALYLGVSRLMLWQNMQAVQTLANAAELLNGPRRQTAEWYRAIALLRTGAPDSQAAFTAICNENSAPYSQSACEVSQQLNSRRASPQNSYEVPR